MTKKEQDTQKSEKKNVRISYQQNKIEEKE